MHPKVAAGGAAAAVTTVLVWVAAMLGVDVPAEVAAALTTLISFGVGYLKSA